MLTTLRSWLGDFRPSRFPYLRFLLTVVIGIAGGLAFSWMRMPLPWMLGPLVFTTIAALFGTKIAAPNAARSPMLVVLGVLLGTGVSPELVSRAPQYSASLVALAVILAISTVACFAFFRLVGGLDRPTSYYSAVPGGITEMILLGEADGGRTRDIATIHAGRILFVILVVPFLLQALSGTMIGGRPLPGQPLFSLLPLDVALFVVTYGLGAIAAYFVRTPTSLLLVPLVLSALIHGSGISTFQAPTELVVAAQLVLGISLGARFVGARIADIGKSLLLSLAASIILISISVGFAFGVGALLHLDPFGLVLSYAPGGVAEMSLVALALHTDAAIVVIHHLARLMMVTLFGRRGYRLLNRLRPRRSP